MARFTDRVFLLSGGARGLGEAQARALLAEGAKVVIGDVLVEDGQRLAEELGEACTFQHLDVTSEAQWSDAVAAAERIGKLHGSVNNAGVYTPRPLTETDTALFERHTRVNQLGTFLGMRASFRRSSAPAAARSSTSRPRWACAALPMRSPTRRPNGQCAA